MFTFSVLLCILCEFLNFVCIKEFFNIKKYKNIKLSFLGSLNAVLTVYYAIFSIILCFGGIHSTIVGTIILLLSAVQSIYKTKNLLEHKYIIIIDGIICIIALVSLLII